jgi:hypothetical protein
MTQTGLFDQPQPPLNPYKIGSQCFRIYHRLIRYQRVTNVEINMGLGGPRIMNTTGRASSIRAFLKPHGIKLHCERIHDGLFEYSIKAQS